MGKSWSGGVDNDIQLVNRQCPRRWIVYDKAPAHTGAASIYSAPPTKLYDLRSGEPFRRKPCWYPQTQAMIVQVRTILE